MTSPRITKNAQDTSDALPPDSAIRRFDVPATIFHGKGCRRELGAIVRGLGGTRVLLVTDPGVVQLGAAGKIVELLTAARPSVARFNAEIDKTAADALASGSPANNRAFRPRKRSSGCIARLGETVRFRKLITVQPPRLNDELQHGEWFSTLRGNPDNIAFIRNRRGH